MEFLPSSRVLIHRQVAQQLQHAFGGLLFSEDAVGERAVRQPVDEHVLGFGDQAMLDPTEAAQRILVGAGIEVADVLRYGPRGTWAGRWR
jgi:hypothetical protein